MKRLFRVVDSNTNNTVEYFSAKQDAKKLRNKLNPERGESFVLGTFERYFISKGPDHRLFK